MIVKKLKQASFNLTLYQALVSVEVEGKHLYFTFKVGGNNIERTLQFLSTDKILSMEKLPSYIDDALSNNAGKEKDLSRSENILLFFLSCFL